MSLTPIESAEALEQALAEAGDELVYVGFFGAFSAVAEETRPHFEAFAKESGARCLVVDLGVAKGAHRRLGVKTVPTAVTVRAGQVIREAAGRTTAEGYARSLVPSDAAPTATGTDAPRRPRVVVYTTPSCAWCTRLKTYLRKQHVVFREIDVSRDANAAAELQRRSGQMGVPQTDIGGQIVVGFDQARIDRLLGLPHAA
ncbi:MAG: hypothetical protein KC619_30270 [Myxococcales bacterium]|nr:hypothetical protein [Myxococcales bacterium]